VTSVAILTKRSLERVAAGATMNFAGSELFELDTRVGDAQVRAIYSREDSEDDTLIALMTGTEKGILPETLRSHQDAALHRILNFAHRADTFPVALPRGWRQHKHDNLMSFLALPEAIARSDRWVVEVNAAQSGDVVFWELTNSQEKAVLEQFVPEAARYLRTRESWLGGRSEALQAMGEESTPSLGIDFSLDPGLQVQSITKARTYSQWLPDLTPSQKEFVEARTDSSIRLRGPAGSGKR
jgi:hypothetical protein